jgi:predicted HTH transcriptional regulator
MKLQINESQNIEFKQTWKDEYIKWLSAFGNADGGKLYIGVDDDGNIKGIDNAKKLLEDIPNKVRDVLGITPQFRWENGLWVEFYFKTDKSLPNGLGDKLGETQQNIIKLMQKNPKIAITALSSKLGISTTAIEKHIKTLKEQNIIQRIGSAKGGHWEIIK